MELFEGGIREPLIARWPGKIKQGRTSGLVSVQFDLMATLAELTHQPIPETDGISFLPELMGKPAQQKIMTGFILNIPKMADNWPSGWGIGRG